MAPLERYRVPADPTGGGCAVRLVVRKERDTQARHGMRRNLVVLLGATALTAATLTGGTGTAAPAGRLVTYHGVSLRVPASWPVIDLDRHPATCARLDRHAVYLGTPGDTAACPPRILGRTETISLRPAAATAAPGSTVVPHGVPEAASRSTDHTGRYALAAAGVELTTTYGSRPELVDDVLATARVTESARPRTIRPAEAAPTSAMTKVPGSFRGYGFDTCAAPSSATMDAWLKKARFRAVGVYIGGGDLGCPNQENLNPSWVSRQTKKGWHVFAMYVGRQAPCSKEPYRIGGVKKAAGQARSDALDAVRQAAHYGLARGSIIMHDMEWYPRGGSCSTAVLKYLSQWTATINAHHYRSGVYSSRAAAIDELTAARKAGTHRMPGTIDFAQWDEKPTVHSRHIPEKYWVRHRMKQYRGAHNETHGGVTLNIDCDWLNVH